MAEMRVRNSALASGSSKSWMSEVTGIRSIDVLIQMDMPPMTLEVKSQEI